MPISMALLGDGIEVYVIEPATKTMSMAQNILPIDLLGRAKMTRSISSTPAGGFCTTTHGHCCPVSLRLVRVGAGALLEAYARRCSLECARPRRAAAGQGDAEGVVNVDMGRDSRERAGEQDEGERAGKNGVHGTCLDKSLLDGLARLQTRGLSMLFGFDVGS